MNRQNDSNYLYGTICKCQSKGVCTKYILEKPVEFYRSLLELMLSEGRIKDNIDLKISAQELNYGLLGISLEFAFVRQTGADVEAILKKFQTMLISYLID